MGANTVRLNAMFTRNVRFINMANFKEKVLAVVKGIPKGKTLTYKEVAQKAGSPRAYRAVGNILKGNYNKLIPCHRVTRSNGTLGGYNHGIQKKLALLKREGAVLNR